MKNKNSVKKNFVYNLIYQILILIIPLITAPYLARVIGAEGVGTYSYTYSIVYYFMLLCLLGVNNYGNRSVAKVRDDKERLSKTFWGIYLFQLLMGIIMLILYIAYIVLFDNEYKTIASIQTLFIISAMLDISWFYFGLEEFKMTIARSTFVKVVNVILIFIFVRGANDLWKYTLIMSGMTVLGQIALWGFLKDKVNFVRIKKQDVLKHIRPNFVLFIPVIAVSLYKIMDKIMLGSLTTVTEVGYYENAEKIINIPLALITTLGTVMLPRISNMVSNGENEQLNEYIKKSMSFVMFLSLAMCMGLIGIGYNFAPIYFGEKFQKTGILIMLLATTLPFLSFANVIRTQYLIPKEKDKEYIFSVSLGAIVNFILNIIFIKRFEGIGACFGTIAAEFVVMFYQVWMVRKELDIKKYIKDSIPFFVKSLIMLGMVYLVNCINIKTSQKLIIQIILGIIIYGLLNLKYILSIVDIKKIVKNKLSVGKI